MGILVTGASSGAHMNPAVSVAMAVWGRLPSFYTIIMMISILGWWSFYEDHVLKVTNICSPCLCGCSVPWGRCQISLSTQHTILSFQHKEELKNITFLRSGCCSCALPLSWLPWWSWGTGEVRLGPRWVLRLGQGLISLIISPGFGKCTRACQ